MDGIASTAIGKNSSTPRILICRLSAIGDCILTMPLASELRRQFPGAFIAWAVQGASAPLMEEHPCVDLAIKITKQELRSPVGLWRLRQRLRMQHFDLALDPQGLTKSALVSWLSGAPRRIGFARPVGREISTWLQTELVHSRQPHVVDRYLELLAPLGINAEQAEFRFPANGAARCKLAPFLDQPHLKDGFAVVNPGAGWDSKVWPAERYAEVAQHLASRHRLPTVVVWAGDREKAWGKEIAAGANGHAFLALKTTLLELGELLRSARLFVGSDTGPLHMAAAVGVSCVGIYGPTRPEECGPYGSGHRAVQAFYQSGSSRERRSAGNNAMRAVSVSDVCEACDDAISQSGSLLSSPASRPPRPRAA
ncbi:MAG: glycosyltransferase family 9 protein [Pirellulaceae bacterium]